LDPEEKHPQLWAAILAASLGTGLLLKSLIGVVFPVAGALIYLAVTRQLFVWRTWQRLRPFSGALIALLIAVPWHVLATLRNPPYFAWTLHSGPGEYHGFLWFYFINEQLLRFLNMRYPRDYNTVPRLWFWLFHFLWLFPWSVYIPSIFKLSFKPSDRAGRTRLLALCWTGFMLVFFTFSTTQEYYSMPCYPALALLIGSAMATESTWVRRETRVLGVIAGLAAVACFAIAFAVRNIPTPGDISGALSRNPSAYSLSLGHMLDLTFDSFAYLRFPLVLAGIAFLIGGIGNLRWSSVRAATCTAIMMILFFQAARLALVVFDPYLTSRPLADAIAKAPPGGLIVTGHYYPYSSVPFYLNRDPLLLNGIRHNLEYGAAALNCPPVFVTNADLARLWAEPKRWYLVTAESSIPKLQQELGADHVTVVTISGGKAVVSNQPIQP